MTSSVMVFGGALVAVLLLLVAAGPGRGVEAAQDCGISNNKTHNFSYGRHEAGERLLDRDHLSYKSKWMRVTAVDVTYPRDHTSTGRITYVEVLDQRADGTGGCAYILKGGPGQRSVTLHLKSQRNHGMEFLIKVYGR